MLRERAHRDPGRSYAVEDTKAVAIRCNFWLGGDRLAVSASALFVLREVMRNDFGPGRFMGFAQGRETSLDPGSSSGMTISISEVSA